VWAERIVVECYTGGASLNK